MQNPEEAAFYSQLGRPVKYEVPSEIPTPNNPPWSSWTAVGVWLLSIFFIVVIPGLFLFPYLISNGITLKDNPAELRHFLLTDRIAVWLQLAPILLAHLATLGVAWVVVTRANRFSFRQTLGWDWNGFKIWHGLAIFAGFYVFSIIMVSILGKVENDFDRMLASSSSAVYLVGFFATFTAPITEEVVYRGLLYSAFQRRLGIIAAAILATVLFTAVHVLQYSDQGAPDYATLIVLLGLSAALTFIRVKTGNLLPCIVLHTIFNGLQVVLLIFETYSRSPETQEQTATAIRFFK